MPFADHDDVVKAFASAHTHGEVYLWRLVQFAKNGSVGHPYEFIRTVHTLSAF